MRSILHLRTQPCGAILIVREHFAFSERRCYPGLEDRTTPRACWSSKIPNGAVAALIEARQRFPDGNVLC